MASTKTVPLWSLTRHVVLCDTAEKVYKLMRNADKKWLQLPCAPVPLKEDTLRNLKVPMTPVAALVGFILLESEDTSSTSDQEGCVLGQGCTKISHAYFQHKRLANDLAYQELRDLESVESGLVLQLARRVRSLLRQGVSRPQLLLSCRTFP